MIGEHNKMKYILTLWCFIVLIPIYGQQSSLFSHYYWNEQYYNPAYVGSKEMLHIQAIERLQWLGMEGAPKTFNFSAHSPLNKDNIALGVNFYNDKIGALSTNGFTTQYAYRLKFKEAKYTLSLGLQAGVEFRNLQSSKLTTDDGMPDPIDPAGFEKSWLPIVGAGAYFYGENFSVGLGVPQLLPKSTFKSEKWGIKPVFQYLISGAYQWNLRDNFRLLPTTTYRIIQAEPDQAEFNLNGILYDRAILGMGVRTDKSTIFMAQFIQPIGKNKLNIGYAYDLSWKPLRTTNSGSHEIMISFDMQTRKQPNIIYKSPRYF